jgi:hypothetical protein
MKDMDEEYTDEQIQEWDKEDMGHIPDGFFLSQEEIEELRNKKFELTQYAKEKLKKLMENKEVEKPLYRFFAIDYYGTGNGRSTYLQISLNNHNDEHYKKQWKHFVNYEYYLQGEENLTEREFLDRYTRLLPDMTVHMLRDKSLTIFQTHLHFNRS